MYEMHAVGNIWDRPGGQVGQVCEVRCTFKKLTFTQQMKANWQERLICDEINQVSMHKYK